MRPCPAFAGPVGVPALPALARLALLLDLDGTLLDLKPSPSEVSMAPGFLDVLERLAARLGGALAVVSGRPVDQVAALLPGLPIAIAGEHGAAIRRGPGLPVERKPLPAVPARWREAARRLAARYPGVLLEEKAHGFVLHYRKAEAAAPALRAAIDELLGRESADFVLVAAVKAWELRPGGVDKGTAVRAILARAPYAGRVPVYIGDDVTDDDGIRAARELGGFGFKVGPVFGDARGVRAWLSDLARLDHAQTGGN
ncbi:MAG: trehalose-phosphatase [Acetobacteraceae bacterium]